MLIAGVDEVGRGPLAGAVVAAAVILQEEITGIRDSKKLTARRRSLLAEKITGSAIFAIGRAEVAEIEALNIHHATLLAMQRAILALPVRPDKLLIDGIHIPLTDIPAEAIVGGDDLEPSIGAASIIAKVTRDREMCAFDNEYPQYGFARHKGYGTLEHRNALLLHGPCPLHRRKFIENLLPK